VCRLALPSNLRLKRPTPHLVGSLHLNPRRRSALLRGLRLVLSGSGPLRWLASAFWASDSSAMCGRYRRTTAEEELARRYRIPIPPQRDLPISWNIAPSQDVLAIRYNPKTKQRSLDPLRWGLIPYCERASRELARRVQFKGE